jgi:5'-nucleotidase
MTISRQGRARTILAALLLPCLVVIGCADDSSTKSDTADTSDQKPAAANTTGAQASEETTSTVAPSESLHILVTNDDGIAAPGIDALVNALSELPDTTVEVVAPAENQSGTSDKTTPEGAPGTPAATASGVAGTAVAGFPADSVIFALANRGTLPTPDLVISGINAGANIGPFVSLSGTVGAAKTAVRNGIPALATSQGLTDNPDYGSGVKYTLEWLAKNRSQVLDGTLAVKVYNLNIPTCTTGTIRGMVTEPTATEVNDREMVKSNCESTVTEFADDVDAFGNGYVAYAELTE